jgi:hypothetical protein
MASKAGQWKWLELTLFKTYASFRTQELKNAGTGKKMQEHG